MYYESLYTSERSPTNAELGSFFGDMPLPSIDDNEKSKLDLPFSENEIKTAINSLPTGKAPGPDGLTVEFYRTFIAQLLPYLQDLYQELTASPHSRVMFHQAIIMVIPKPEKDPGHTTNYHQISLLNLENKIFAKILAMRMEDITPKLIHPNQTGFVKERLSADNARIFCNVLHIVGKDRHPIAAISIDAEKAFDCVEWSYLYYTLKKFGFGPAFKNMIWVLYSAPSARISANGQLSAKFQLQRGTRQGCPLSPLLFILVLEPLLQKIRADERIRGITSRDNQVKLSAYGDDVLIYLSNPSSSFPTLLNLIGKYDQVSGYKANWSKMEVLPLNVHCTKEMFDAHPIAWKTSSIKYLGMQFAPTIEETSLNVEKQIEGILTRATQTWLPLNISWWGRLDTIKMILTPQINYLLSVLPILLLESAYKKIDRALSKFLWKGKQPRILLKKLKLDKSAGGSVSLTAKPTTSPSL